MNSYFIEELNREVTYIEVRLLFLIDCQLKIDKISKLLNHLRNKGFISHLTMVYEDDASRFQERKDIMSLSIDESKGKLRFKFWNGASTQWLYHTDDVINAINTGREKFSDLYDKYELLTDLLFDFKRRWNTFIYDITYDYSQNDFDIVYNIIFYEDFRDSDSVSKVLNKLNIEVDDACKDIGYKLSFRMESSFRAVGCTPCEQARKEREKNE